MSNVRQLREKQPENEKITINLGFVDLGRIDLLVQEGFYSNRSDFIRTAIRKQLDHQSETVTRSIDRHTMEMGLRDYSVADLEAVQAAKKEINDLDGLVAKIPNASPVAQPLMSASP